MGTVLPRIFFSVGLAALLFSALPAGNLSAQTPGQLDGSISPPYPGPNQPFVVTLESFSADLDRAFITWRRNGVVATQGVGQKRFSGSTGKPGQELRLSVTADTKEAGRLEKTFVIRPAALELVWQADTYAPPLYKGKALATPESGITLVALAEFLTSRGAAVPNAEIVFTWKRNGRVLASQSGTGKNTFSFTAPYLAEDMPLIEVEARTQSGTDAARAEVLVPVSEPRIVFYEQNDLLGTLENRALPESFILAAPELSLAAYPFFLGGENRDGGEFSYSWRLNGALLPEHSASRITLRRPDETGESVLSVAAEKIGAIFGSAARSIRLNYER